jgi:hypothetical protein
MLLWAQQAHIAGLAVKQWPWRQPAEAEGRVLVLPVQLATASRMLAAVAASWATVGMRLVEPTPRVESPF